MPLTLAQLAERWKDAPPAERANFQSYVIQLSEALGVEPPGRAESGYEFERPIRITERDGTETTNFVDYETHFLAREHAWPAALVNVGLQIVLGLAAVWLGHRLVTG